MPTAAADTLGGVKVGTGLSINAETGVLTNNNPTAYTLPTAAADTLGGVKVGTGLSIADGVLSANTQYTVYSTTPIKVGTWIDGRDIYRVVYDNIALTNSAEVAVDANFGNTKDIIAFNCITKIASGTGKIQRPIQSLVVAGNDYAYPYVNIDSLNIMVHGNWTGETATLIIDYVEQETEE